MPRNATFKVQAHGREFCRQLGIKTTVSQGLGAGHRELEGLRTGLLKFLALLHGVLHPLEGWGLESRGQREAGCVSNEC